ncbi:SDR family oxidoreductase [Rhodococcus sp. D2-41]|uniref:SDR family oxidoreductase n=1 Tax=Speluncibacter jeojiensis TaxID=2710754 RepID=A0A9X4RD11_9ACTN|nr:SDR family NAD(P)-dependent oxidoreductase [Rhodococcus sp. D2-41]MDG3010368.1 SDR family oxidoreductase [Rhodococcus sp. D2-41]MDG3014104.1 SDR family oxidoreductase [Corynebacteriales bacterium D3-21]
MADNTFDGSRFAGKVAVVTGAASGIGAAVATRLIGEGASVVGIDITGEALDRMAGELGDRFVGATADVTVESEVAAAVGVAVERFGALDLAFNVAGAARGGKILDLEESDWDFTIDLVQKGVFLCTKHEARHMVERGGAIVNVASLNAHVPMHGGSPYVTGKAGVEMFGKNAALELAAHGIRVNTVLPGLVDTPLVAGVTGYEPLLTGFLERIPMGRPATPDEIAAPCLYLASDDAGYITGSSLMVDGGWELSNYPDIMKIVGGA